MHNVPPRTRQGRRAFALAVSLLIPVVTTGRAAAGGGSENAVLVVDPGNAESLYVANVYLDRRDVPRGHAVYLPADASNWVTFVAENQRGFEGALVNQRVRDRADFVVIPPGGSFFLGASGFVSDSCFPVNRFSIASAFTLADEAATIQGGTAYWSPNQFAQDGWDAHFFDAEVPWSSGLPSAGGQRYRIGAMLGYTGANGNTLQEVLDLIDRSAAADATHPGGTFYYVETTDAARSAPRDHAYAEAVAQMAGVGGTAEHILSVLPTGEHDCLGVMTGWASPDIDGADYTILPGAFCDHLTSFAGMFDTSSQTKMSEWIEKGASGTSGTVEEPCNYSGKFPHARLHVQYRQGVALGEAWLASLDYLPFQQLLYGDPLTAPWASPPTVDVPDLPAGAVAGSVALTPIATALAAGAGIRSLELLVDGVTLERVEDGGAFLLDTTLLADGPHEVRVVATDDTDVRNVGRFVGTIQVANAGVSVTATPAVTSGDLATALDVGIATVGGALDEVRLLQGGRVVAAGGPGTTSLTVHGQNVGAGPVRLFVEADFTGGARARSAPIELDVAYAGSASATPVAYGFTREVAIDTDALIELPASFPDDLASAAFSITQSPGQATVLSHHGGPWVVIEPAAGATGLDSLTFEVTTPGGTSAPATITWEYTAPHAFLDPDFFALDAIVPAAIPALSPGTAQTFELQGGGFGPGTVVEVNGVPLGGLPSPTTLVSPASITVDLPQVPLGTATIGVRDGDFHDELTVPVVPAAAPTLQMASGDDGAFVFTFAGVDAILAGTPGATQVLLASVFPDPTDLPGWFHLDLGAAFSFIHVIGTFAVDPVLGYTEVTIPLAGVPPATTVYAQSLELSPTLPFPESNRQEFLVLF